MIAQWALNRFILIFFRFNSDDDASSFSIRADSPCAAFSNLSDTGDVCTEYLQAAGTRSEHDRDSDLWT